MRSKKRIDVVLARRQQAIHLAPHGGLLGDLTRRRLSALPGALIRKELQISAQI